ncbi:uncharacterized protein [Montipora capricornis]|uniref:uncharacterized protein n=1 Tax=Montipora capricornis TaxID=246305 RepID=UPI0035F1E7C7
MGKPQISMIAAVLLSFMACVISFPYPWERSELTYAIKSFSAGKYLRVTRSAGAGVFNLSFTGNLDICDSSNLFYQRKNYIYSAYESVAFQGHYLAVENGTLTLLNQSSSRLEEKCQFSLHRVYIRFNFDNTTLYHAVKSLSADSYIRSSKSGNIMIRKKWKVDCGVWLHFQHDHSCS